MSGSVVPKIVPRLRFPLRRKPRRLRTTNTLGTGPDMRLEKIKPVIGGLFKHERIEGSQLFLEEARGYAEQLIALAIIHGDKDKETMEMVDFWVQDKTLIPKVFNELAPRYQGYSTAFTRAFMLPTVLPVGQQRMVLELKGNDLPPVNPHPTVTKNYLTNVLLSAARRQDRQDRLDQVTDGAESNESQGSRD